MYLVMKMSLNSPDCDHLCDTKETALLLIRKLFGEQGNDFANYREMGGIEGQSAYEEYYKKYGNNDYIDIIFIDPVNDLITMETLFEMSL